MNVHGLKKKLKNINKSLGQHYKKRHLINLSIDQLESTKKDINSKLFMARNKNKKVVKNV